MRFVFTCIIFIYFFDSCLLLHHLHLKCVYNFHKTIQIAMIRCVYRLTPYACIAIERMRSETTTTKFIINIRVCVLAARYNEIQRWMPNIEPLRIFFAFFHSPAIHTLPIWLHAIHTHRFFSLFLKWMNDTCASSAAFCGVCIVGCYVKILRIHAFNNDSDIWRLVSDCEVLCTTKYTP